MIERLKKIDVNATAPIDALSYLYEFQEAVKKTK
jgi:hypothetical protein